MFERGTEDFWAGYRWSQMQERLDQVETRQAGLEGDLRAIAAQIDAWRGWGRRLLILLALWLSLGTAGFKAGELATLLAAVLRAAIK